jgi:anaerobic magnesium-protoporphyrin IX monomethyl ester cyclase
VKIKIIVAPQTNPDPYWKPLQPLGVATIAAYLKKKGHKVDIDDLDIRTIVANRSKIAPSKKINLEPFRNTEKVKAHLIDGKPNPYLDKLTDRLASWTDYKGYDIVALSMATRSHQLNTALCLAKRIKEETGAIVILGGRRIYPQIIGEYPFLDYGVLMDTGENMEKFIQLIEKGDIKEKDIPHLMYRVKDEVRIGPPFEIDLGNTCYPDYSGLPIELYKYEPYLDLDDSFPKEKIHVLPYHAIEGCVGTCVFCSSRPEKLRIKPVERIGEEVGRLKKEFNTNCFMFTSNEINISPKFLKGFTDAITPHKILWTDSARLDNIDKEMMKSIADSGCVQLTYGLESGSQRLLDSMKKGVDLTHAANILRWGYEYGIWSHVNIIAGLPFETDEDIKATIDFLNENSKYITSVTINKFFVAYNSVIEQHPKKFGLKLRRETQTRFSNVILESNVFDEIDGLSWEEKRDQQEKSVQLINQQYRKEAGAVVPIPTLFYLYSVLGRDLPKIEETVKKFNLMNPYGRYG